MKNQRILDIYLRLLNNREVIRKNLAQEYKVSERSIHRDISDLRTFLVSTNSSSEIIYDDKTNSYVLINEDNQKLNNSEILAVCKILLDSSIEIATLVLQQALSAGVTAPDSILTMFYRYIDRDFKIEELESLPEKVPKISEYKIDLDRYNKFLRGSSK